MMPGRISGSVIVRNTQSAVGAERAGGVFEAAVDGLDRQADRAHHQRKAHHRRRPAPRRSSGTRRRCRSARRGSAPIGPRRPNSEQQQVAGDDRRQDQRQMHDAVEQRLARRSGRAPAAARRRCRPAGWPASATSGDLQAQPDRGPFFRREVSRSFSDRSPRSCRAEPSGLAARPAP